MTLSALAHHRLRPPVFALVAGLALPTLTSAQTLPDTVSTYTSTAPQDCRSERPRTRGEPNDGGTRACPGLHGFVVIVSEGDLRETVSIGRNRALADREPAAKTWFGPFSSTATTVEWRSRRRGSRPFAIIQRWYLADNNDPDKDGRPRDKQLIIVTRLPPGLVCHVAYIDVEANANASELARKAADTARAFDCAKDKVRMEGTSGRATELAQ